MGARNYVGLLVMARNVSCAPPGVRAAKPL